MRKALITALFVALTFALANAQQRDLIVARDAGDVIEVNSLGTWRYNGNLTTGVLLNIPPREMWGWGPGVDGYCGEASFQIVGIYYGNYVSQEEVRYADGDEELLVAVNDEDAASTLKYVYSEWDYDQKTPQSTKFLDTIKSNLDKGIPMIAGWYERQPKGDADYDHVMPIVGYDASSAGKVSAVYHVDFYIRDYTITTTAELFATRKECTQTKTPVQPYDYCLPEDVDYGILVSGNIDKNKETFRTLLEMDRWNEPDWGAEDKLHEKPVAMSVKAHISGLTAGKKYSVLRFDDPRSIPSSNFLAGSYDEKYDFVATSSDYTMSIPDTIMSDGSYFFRTVLSQ